MDRRLSERLPEWFPLWLLSWARNWLAALLALAVFAAFVGLPHLRVSYEGYSLSRGQINYTRCTYLGPLGLWRATPGREVYEECPIIVMREVL